MPCDVSYGNCFLQDLRPCKNIVYTYRRGVFEFAYLRMLGKFEGLKSEMSGLYESRAFLLCG